jgi:hypothetical protein
MIECITQDVAENNETNYLMAECAPETVWCNPDLDYEEDISN